MEMSSCISNLVTKITHIYNIMPFYGYCCESFNLIKLLCHESYKELTENRQFIARFFAKHIIDLRDQKIDAKSIEALK